MRRITIRLLGPFEVTIDGAAVTTFAYAKVRAAGLSGVERQHPHPRAELRRPCWCPGSVRVNTQVHPYSICSRRSDPLLLGLPLFEPCLEPQQAFIPYGADGVDPLLKFAQRFRRQDIALFSPFLMHSNQARSFKDREMLENTLPRDWVFLGKLGRRLGTALRQLHQQVPTHRVCQRSEDQLLLFMGAFSHHNVSTPPGPLHSLGRLTQFDAGVTHLAVAQNPPG